jgi:hypothetical protein
MCVYVCTHACMDVCVCMFVCMCEYMYIGVCIHVYDKSEFKCIRSTDPLLSLHTTLTVPGLSVLGSMFRLKYSLHS